MVKKKPSDVNPRLIWLNLNLQGVSQIKMVKTKPSGCIINMVKNKPSDVYPRLIWLKLNLQ